MNIFDRVATLLSANINHLLDKAEDPEVMVKQIIRDMEEGIIELRRETVRAMGRQKQLERQIADETDRSADLEKKAAKALSGGDEKMALQILEKKLATLDRIRFLKDESAAATEFAGQLKTDLFKMEDQVQSARRKKEELIRRKRAADARLRTQDPLTRSEAAFSTLSSSIDANIGVIESYKDKITLMEAEAEATEELLGPQEDPLAELKKAEKQKALHAELLRLKQQVKEDQETKK